MKVNDELFILEVPMDETGERIMNISVIVDKEHGLTLVDTGLPGQSDLIESKLNAEGFTLRDIKQIVLTHQDLDHVGSLHVLKDRTRAMVYALAEEVPYIDGRVRPIKMPSPEQLEQNPAWADRIRQLQPTGVDGIVEDGEVLTRSGNAKAIATPGHTPGHMCLYLPGSKTLIAGDASVAQDGKLIGPMEQATPNMPEAMDSLRKLAGLDIDTIVCYHGGLVTEDAAEQLRIVAGQPPF